MWLLGATAGCNEEQKYELCSVWWLEMCGENNEAKDCDWLSVALTEHIFTFATNGRTTNTVYQPDHVRASFVSLDICHFELQCWCAGRNMCLNSRNLHIWQKNQTMFWHIWLCFGSVALHWAVQTRLCYCVYTKLDVVKVETWKQYFMLSYCSFCKHRICQC